MRSWEFTENSLILGDTQIRITYTMIDGWMATLIIPYFPRISNANDKSPIITFPKLAQANSFII